MTFAGVVGIVAGAVIVANLLLTAFGGLRYGPARLRFDRFAVATFKACVVYVVAMLVYTTFAGLSPDRAVRSVLGNIFTVTLVLVLAAVLLSDFVPEKKSGK